MSTQSAFLDNVYGLDGAEKTLALYEEWARTYDAEVLEHGYVSPKRCTDALASVVSDKNAPLLDLGCGTGLSGEAFHDGGFTTIDGTDFSEKMLKAAQTKGCYRKLTVGDLHNPIPAKSGEYQNIAAVGVFSPGHAPPEMIEEVVDLLPQGGHFVFTLNDHALEEGIYEPVVKDLADEGKVSVVFNEYGEHLPGKDLKSRIYVVKRL